MTFDPTHNAISSPVSGDGPTPCDSPGGPTIAPSGPALARVNLTPRQARAVGMTTRETYGGPSGGSLISAVLQQSLENRLRAKMAVDGSPEYVLTWKRWDMESGAPICALRARARPISDNGYFGWPTPMAGNPGKPGQYNPAGNTDSSRRTVALLIGWATPLAGDGSKVDSTLPAIMRRMEKGQTIGFAMQARLVGWATPTARDMRSEHGSPGMMERRSERPEGKPLSKQVLGLTTSSYSAKTATDAPRLNPAHSRWLMGFPPEWDVCAVMVTLLFPKSRRGSSKRV